MAFCLFSNKMLYMTDPVDQCDPAPGPCKNGAT